MHFVIFKNRVSDALRVCCDAVMSADKKEGVVSKGLESGAALFIPKPVSPDDLRNLWKFAAMKKKSQVLIEETASKSNKGCDSKKDTKTKPPSDDKRVKNSKLTSTKKHKVIWNNALHNRFLEAIRSIGLDSKHQFFVLKSRMCVYMQCIYADVYKVIVIRFL